MKDSQRLTSGVREDAPCKNCTERFIACSDRCPKDERGEFGYKTWKAKLEKNKEAKKAYERLNRRKSWQRKTF